MMKKLNWRLSKLPTPSEVTELVKDKIITQEEAREILFSLETEEDRDKKSLESEIKFLRELVEKLSNGNNTRIVEVIKEVYRPYYQYHWYQPYTVWMGTTGGTRTYATNTLTPGSNITTVATNANTTSNSNPLSSFSSIKTF